MTESTTRFNHEITHYYKARDDIPEKIGVYVLVDDDRGILKVGRSGELNRRVKQYPTNYIPIFFRVTKTHNQSKQIESQMIEYLHLRLRHHHGNEYFRLEYDFDYWKFRLKFKLL